MPATNLKNDFTKIVKHHRSIQEFPKTDLPDFTVITGVNGSGISHWLEAIQNGAIIVDGISSAVVHIQQDHQDRFFLNLRRTLKIGPGAKL